MQIQITNNRNLLITIFIFVVAALRVAFNMNGQLHMLTNFSAIGAMALFGGAYFSKPGASFTIPLATLFISDVILALTVYKQYSHGILYSGWYWVYGAFALMVLVGKLMLKDHISVQNVLIAALTITAIHWVVSDIGVWWSGTTYPRTLNGWLVCMAAAIPFEKNFLLGTLFYSGIMFGAFEWVKKYSTALKVA